MMNNISFISNNFKGIQAILKRIKIFEYLKNYVTSLLLSFFFKKHTLPSKMKKYGETNLKGSYFSFMGKPTPVVLPLVLWVQRLCKDFLNIKRNNLGRILVIEVKIDDSMLVVIKIYDGDTKPEQLHTLNDLLNILETFKEIQNKNVVLGGDFNIILNPSLNSEGGKPAVKKKTIAKLMQK